MDAIDGVDTCKTVRGVPFLCVPPVLSTVNSAVRDYRMGKY